MMLLWWLVVPDWPLHWVMFPALIPFLLFVPGIVRYSRVLYVHLEQMLDAGLTEASSPAAKTGTTAKSPASHDPRQDDEET